MKLNLIISFSPALFFCGVCSAQTGMAAAAFKPAAGNQPGKQFPQVNAEGRVRAGILAPGAQKVQLDLGGKKFDLPKYEKGVWTGESLPQDEGFHYYQLNIDGASVPDPGSIQHLYTEYPGGHTWPVWRNNLYNFAQRLFK